MRIPRTTLVPEADQLLEVQNAVAKINAMTQVNTTSEDYYPILHTPLSVHNGISVSGKFLTNTTNAIPSYVTVLRQATTRASADGLGFAWTVGSGSLYNVYLVDSNPLNSDLMFNESFLLQNAGENTFLATAKGVIATNTQYSFRMDIGLNYTIDLWIWPTSEGGLNVNGVNTIHIAHSGFEPKSLGDHFGISVLGTKGGEWYYDDLRIESIASLHTAALYKLKADTSTFADGTEVTAKFYGYGYDGTTYGAVAYIYKPLTSSWELMGSNLSTNTTPTNNTLISKTFTMGSAYRDISDFVQILVTTPLTGLTASEVSTYYVSLSNVSPAGIHIGGKSDVYIEDPDNIVVAEQLIDNIDGTINLSAANGFGQSILNVARILVVATNEELQEFADWELYSNDKGVAYSTREVPYVSITPAAFLTQLKVTYRYNQKGAAVQALLDSDDHRFIGTDSLAKLIPPVIIRINTLNYKGSLTADRAAELLKNYIINTKTVVISEMVLLLMTNGATYIDTTTIDVQAIEYDHERNVASISNITTSYTAPSFRVLYSDAYDMSGITKL